MAKEKKASSKEENKKELTIRLTLFLSANFLVFLLTFVFSTKSKES